MTKSQRPDKPMCKVGEDVACVRRETYDRSPIVSYVQTKEEAEKPHENYDALTRAWKTNLDRNFPTIVTAYSSEIKNVVFRPDKRRVTIVFDGFSTRATCKEGEEYRPLLGFLIAYFKAVKMLQGWNGRRIQRFFEGVLYYLPPEEQEAYLKAVYFENAKPTFKQALALFDDVEAYWEKRL
jgi:hypothetical protein